MNTTTEKKRFTTRDVMVIAAMMVLTFAVYTQMDGAHAGRFLQSLQENIFEIRKRR